MKHDILYKYQFGFRKNHSTTMALIILIDKILSSLNKGDYVVGIFLDLRKAFDTVNHEILMQKLYKYGVRGISYNWFKSYLYQRQQYVLFSDFKSTTQYITCGIPQGSILGPLLFLFYINDLAQVSSVIFPILFADDTNLIISGNCLNQLINEINSEMLKVTEWLNINKLSLNVEKTHYIIFCTINKYIKTDENIFINNQLIKRVHSSKFLGVIVDSNICWNDHINYIRRKISNIKYF